MIGRQASVGGVEIRKELELDNKEIVEMPELVLLTTVDLITEEEKAKKLKALKKVAKPYYVC